MEYLHQAMRHKALGNIRTGEVKAVPAQLLVELQIGNPGLYLNLTKSPIAIACLLLIHELRRARQAEDALRARIKQGEIAPG